MFTLQVGQAAAMGDRGLCAVKHTESSSVLATCITITSCYIYCNVFVVVYHQFPVYQVEYRSEQTFNCTVIAKCYPT